MFMRSFQVNKQEQKGKENQEMEHSSMANTYDKKTSAQG